MSKYKKYEGRKEQDTTYSKSMQIAEKR